MSFWVGRILISTLMSMRAMIYPIICTRDVNTLTTRGVSTGSQKYGGHEMEAER